jgi:two-component system sensor histidine kinase KdpD
MKAASMPRETAQRPAGRAAGRYALALAATLAACAVSALLQPHLAPANTVMLFLLAVVVVAVRLGRGPAVLAVVTSVLSFDFFFVTPYFSFAVSDAQYLVTFAVMLIVGLVITELTARARNEALVAQQREARAISLYELARELTAAPTAEQVAAAAGKVIDASLGAHARVLVLGEHDSLDACDGSGAPDDDADARRAFERGAALVDASGRICLPLDAPMRRRGVLVVAPAPGQPPLSEEQRRLLETYAALVAIALERVHYVAVAQRTLLAMESERLRGTLLAALSHDLRTPLTAMAGRAEALALRAPDATVRAEADALRRETTRMSRLVANLLDMARLQDGNVRLNRDWQSLEELVGTALSELHAAIGPRRIDVELPPDLPLVRCDAVLIERVLVNLLDNAAKYAPPDARIGIAARVEDVRLLTTVWDEGPGLPPGREAAMFARFTRGDAESAVPGVGLGLAIARAVVEAHGGSLDGARRPGGGSAFTFTLPLETPPASSGDDLQPVAAGGAAS